MLDAIGAGLCKGAEMARISISGGETAQLKDIVNGFDLVGMAIGRVELDKIVSGKGVVEGDVVIGVRSNGVHSNGLSLARKAFFENNRYSIDHKFDELGRTIGEELLRPTDIYVREALEILQRVKGVRALINITSDGLLNLARVEAPAGFEIDRLFEPHPIFDLIQRHANVETARCSRSSTWASGSVTWLLRTRWRLPSPSSRIHGRIAQPIGYAVPDPERQVRIHERSLIGIHKTFKKDDRPVRKVS